MQVSCQRCQLQASLAVHSGKESSVAIKGFCGLRAGVDAVEKWNISYPCQESKSDYSAIQTLVRR
jgi:hypothetical protein